MGFTDSSHPRQLYDWSAFHLRRLQRSLQPSRTDRDAASIGDTPWMEPEMVDFLDKHLSKKHTYIEYGAGSSTLFAIKRAGRVVSVETDPIWFAALQRRIGSAANFEPIPIYIGATKILGYPVFQTPTPNRIRQWRQYIDGPWNKPREDVGIVLVDGRFRVACAIKSLLSANDRTTIVMDDFADADRGYSAVYPFIVDRMFVGRPLTFRKSPRLDVRAAKAVLDKYGSNPR